MCVRVSIHPRIDAGDAPEGARKICRIIVAQLMRDIGHFRAGVLQQLAGGLKSHLIQHLGIAATGFGQFALQTALTGIAQRGGELDTQIAFLNIGLQQLLE